MMRLSSDKIWAAVNVKPNQANKAEANLMRQGLVIFAPRIKITKRQQNRFIHRFDLFFPGYIFVHIDTTTDDARKVRSTYGVSNIVRVGDNIGALPDAFIEAMRNSTHEMHNQASVDLTPGQKVEIVSGPFAGLVAELIKVDANQRVKCLFGLISGKVSVSLAANDLILLK
jgi:transcriptional antiterminator RfaH